MNTTYSVSDLLRGTRIRAAGRSVNTPYSSASDIQDIVLGQSCVYACPEFTSIITVPFDTNKRDELAAITFFLVNLYTDDTNNDYFSLIDSSPPVSTTLRRGVGALTRDATNADINGSPFVPRRMVGVNSLSNLTNYTQVNRAIITDELNSVLSMYSLNYINPSSILQTLSIRASLDSTGHIVFSLQTSDSLATGSPTQWLGTNQMFGIFFGDADNGSTSLGLTGAPPKGVAAIAVLFVKDGPAVIRAYYPIPA